jgi:TRAP-type transport system periplasmic protein
MQQEMMKRLGATPVAMSLGDVLPALQQGAIDGALSGIPVYTTMKYWDAARYVTEINQPVTFSMAFISAKWFESLPNDLQVIIGADAAKAAAEINPWQIDFYAKQSSTWAEHGELISLPPSEQAQMMQELVEVAVDVAKRKPGLQQALAVFTAAANRTRDRN